jgi:hypothetical protein
MPRIAFYTFGLLIEPLGHPALRGFEDRVDPVSVVAAACDGFITSVQGWDAQARFVNPSENRTAQTLTLWRDLESVYAFAYFGPHAEAVRRRTAWFVKGAWPGYVAWWVAVDHEPNFTEAVERFAYLHDHGPTPYAFTFRTAFDAGGQPVALDRRRITNTPPTR